MSTALISFLGRTPKEANGYRQTTYQFSDGEDTAAYFGFSLLRRVQPDRMVILGTAGSMWDHLFERDLNLGMAMEDERMALVEAVESGRVSQAQLSALEPALADALQCNIELRLTPYARLESEQAGLVQTLADAARGSDCLHLDVTHGYRHLPMLAMMALLYLRAIRPALRIEKVWYGAFDEDTGNAHVHDLAGLLEIAYGADALARFDADGNYQVLAPLVPDGLRDFFLKAAFYERTQQVGKARGQIRKARDLLLTQPDQSYGDLFHEALLKRLDWAGEERMYQRQRELARGYLHRGDELRAALYGYEAAITRFMQAESPSCHVDNFEQRQVARERFRDELRSASRAEFKDFKLLNHLRNQLAHGMTSGVSEVQQVMDNEQALRDTLSRLFERLLPDLD